MPPKEEALMLAGETLPAYLTASTDGRELIDQSDLSLPRLLVMNALSDQVKAERARQGDMVESVTGNVVYERKAGKPVKGVFIALRRMRQRWRGKGQGAGIECFSADGNTAGNSGGICKGVATNNCGVCEYAQFAKKADGSIAAPQCTEYREFLVLLEDYPLPVILSLGKSAAKQGKKLVEKLNGDMGMTNRPLYAFQFELSTSEMQGGGNKWWAADIKPAGFPSEKLFLQAKSLYEKHKTSLKKQAIIREDDAAEASPADNGPSLG